MENFAGAYIARKKDVLAFIERQEHSIASFHLGGVTIECQLKSLLVSYHKITEWGDLSRRDKDSMCNTAINNPNHSLKTALKHLPEFYKRAKLDRQFLLHLEKIIRPLGSTDVDYISLRYIANTTQSQQEWQKSFDYVCGWLEKNRKSIL
jgi:hypothetical protein